jgi:outer membrane biosynthesis protein TonB
MLVQPTLRWLNSVTVPYYGILARPPRNQNTVDVLDRVGIWLIDNGYAVGKKEVKPPVTQIPVVQTPTPAPKPSAAQLPITEPVKLPKKPPTKPFVLEKEI